MTTLETMRWGIMGTGRIAATCAAALEVLPNAELAAVGSRSETTAAGFAQRVGAARSFGSYAGLANAPELDIIYVATPHACHHANTRLCLQAGKAVLCEKLFTFNAAQARDLVHLARERRLFLMEAMWTRCLPPLSEVRRHISDGTIGDVRFLVADFGFRKAFDPAHRLFDLALGGGALLDVGVYLASLASMLIGSSRTMQTEVQRGASGIDEQSALLLGYEGGQFAQLTATITATTSQEAVIGGRVGRFASGPLGGKPRA